MIIASFDYLCSICFFTFFEMQILSDSHVSTFLVKCQSRLNCSTYRTTYVARVIYEGWKSKNADERRTLYLLFFSSVASDSKVKMK